MASIARFAAMFTLAHLGTLKVISPKLRLANFIKIRPAINIHWTIVEVYKRLEFRLEGCVRVGNAIWWWKWNPFAMGKSNSKLTAEAMEKLKQDTYCKLSSRQTWAKINADWLDELPGIRSWNAYQVWRHTSATCALPRRWATMTRRTIHSYASIMNFYNWTKIDERARGSRMHLFKLGCMDLACQAGWLRCLLVLVRVSRLGRFAPGARSWVQADIRSLIEALASELISLPRVPLAGWILQEHNRSSSRGSLDHLCWWMWITSA